MTTRLRMVAFLLGRQVLENWYLIIVEYSWTVVCWSLIGGMQMDWGCFVNDYSTAEEALFFLLQLFLH